MELVRENGVFLWPIGDHLGIGLHAEEIFRETMMVRLNKAVNQSAGAERGVKVLFTL